MQMVSLSFFSLATRLFLHDRTALHSFQIPCAQCLSLGSTWHVVDYDTATGRVIRKRTAQGYSDNSTWSRGQSWGIYGFANSESGSPIFVNPSLKLV